jgi:glycosyltransferase 2 family protein
MRPSLRRWWPVVKALLCLAILTLIGRQFVADLRRPELWMRPVHPGWLLASGFLYLVGIGFSAVFWGRLMAYLGPMPSTVGVARAYYLGHLGKYVPGKAWALLLRAWLARDAGAAPGVAGLTAFYEVLTTMCSGVLLAAVFFSLFGTGGDDVAPSATASALLNLLWPRTPESEVIGRWTAAMLSLLLAGLIGVWLLPALFNRLAHRLSLPFRARDSILPRLRISYLVEGLALTAIGWLCLGASLGAGLRGVTGEVLEPSPVLLARLTATIGLAYVAGFVVLVAPGGIGVREFFLMLLLVPELTASGKLTPEAARGLVVLTVLVLRLVWTLSELAVAAGLYFTPSLGACRDLGRGPGT